MIRIMDNKGNNYYHSRFIKAKSKFDLKGKLLRFGLSKGFESHLLYDLLNDWE